MTEATAVKKSWNVFYENAWALRKRFIQELIEKGEKDPYRIVKLVEQHERYHQVQAKGSGTDGRFVRKEIPENEITNIIKDERGQHKVTSYTHLPSRMHFSKRRAFNTDYVFDSFYSECNKVALISDYLQDKSFDAIIELGSGYSQNLIRLYYEGGPKIPYYGGEYTQSGTECAQLLGSLLPEMKLSNFIFDYNNPSFGLAGKFKKVFVFTCHSIEQVEHLKEETLEFIAGLGEEVTCMHFEPFGFQIYQGENEVDKAHRNNFTEKGWNKNLFWRLLNAHEQEKINLTYLGKNIVGSSENGTNPTSLALWHNVESDEEIC